VAFNAYNPVATSTFPQKYSPVDHKDYKRVDKRPNQESANTDPAGWSGDDGDDSGCGSEDSCDKKDVSDGLVDGGHGVNTRKRSNPEIRLKGHFMTEIRCLALVSPPYPNFSLGALSRHLNYV